MSEHMDGCYAICPHCGERHGDCWEWLTDEQPAEFTCQECGKLFTAWAVYGVQYHTDFPESMKK